MSTGNLLEQLISIAQISKTDFALKMNMAPSGLSKILTSRRLPFSKERRLFSKQAAKCLAQGIFAPHCYLKFESLFPVIYDFASQQELELFLENAVSYALDRDFALEDGGNTEYPPNEISYVGKKEVLNMFCLILSDGLRGGGSMELYSTLPFLSGQYGEIFRRIKICRFSGLDDVVLNQRFEISFMEDSVDGFDMNALSRIVCLEKYLDLRLWRVDRKIEYHFLLSRGQFLLQFSIQLDGTPMLTWIRHKGYLAVFYNALMKWPTQKLSYTTAEATAFLEENPGYFQSLAEGGIHAVYNALSIGYMLEEKDLTPSQRRAAAARPMLKLFKNILKGDATFHVTIDAMVNIAETGKALMPLVGAVELAWNQRIPYLQRFQPYVDDRSTDKVKIINGEIPKMAVLCAQELALVYIADDSGVREKIHCFATDRIKNVLDGELAKYDMPTLPFSMELWDAYLGEISKNLLP